jgi:hypothetical protein
MSPPLYLHRLTGFRDGTHTGVRPTAAGDLTTESGCIRGLWESPLLDAGCAVKSAIASWNATVPPGAWLEVQARFPTGSALSRWYSCGRWSSGPLRGSIAGQADGDGSMETDTLFLRQPSRSVQLRVILEGRGALHRLYLQVTGPDDRPEDSARAGDDRSPAQPGIGWGVDLPVPCRSQRVYPEGARDWCSPVSLSMVLAYWGTDLSVPDVVAPAVYDPVYRGWGNWPFNTAVAGLYGFHACVARLPGLTAAERWVTAGVPVVASVRYRRESLEGAPIEQTDGHLLVIRGFTPGGDVIVNEPAAPSDETVRLVYRREQFERAWLLGSGGIVYLVHPSGHPIPDGGEGAW